MTGQRRSIRLKDHDYATPGAYFVTICTASRRQMFRQPRFKGIVEGAWSELTELFPAVVLDEMVIMPDHIHLLLRLLGASGSAAQGASRRAPTLADAVRALKGNAARRINALRGSPGAAVWQRNYYERVVRSEKELERVREYITNNPLLAHEHARDDTSDAWRQRPRAPTGDQPIGYNGA